ncbi:MAG: hypothetical protein IJA60_07250 [Clostridia bacterium]|nr:hypothetical protein [Clostridia bacterium]
MSTLRDYVGEVLNAELTCYTYYNAIREFKEERNKYDVHYTANSPQLEDDSISGEDIMGSLVVGLLFWLGGFIAMGILLGMMFDSIKNSVSTEFIIFMIFGFPVIIAIVGIVIMIKKDKSAVTERNEYKMREYNRERERCKQINAENDIKVRRIDEQLAELRAGQSVARNQRETLYSVGVIHKDYRHLYQVAKIFEYLDTGICTSLEGSTGAYILCRQETRMETLADLLVQIRNDIRELKGICYSLYEGINTANQQIGKLCSSMDETLRLQSKIEKNTQITAYNSQIAANEARIQSDMMIYSSLIN